MPPQKYWLFLKDRYLNKQIPKVGHSVRIFDKWTFDFYIQRKLWFYAIALVAVLPCLTITQFT